MATLRMLITFPEWTRIYHHSCQRATRGRSPTAAPDTIRLCGILILFEGPTLRPRRLSIAYRRYPYEKPIDRATIPPHYCYEEATSLGLPLAEFIELPTEGGPDSQVISSVLRGTRDFDGRALTAGLPIYPSFFDTDESGFVMDPTDEEKEWGPSGYDLMALVGAFLLEIDCGEGGVFRTRYYILRNSWGESFGDHGDVYVSERYLLPMLMCCVTMFHVNELSAWSRTTPCGMIAPEGAAATANEERSGVLVCLAVAAMVLACLGLVAFVKLSRSHKNTPPVAGAEPYRSTQSRRAEPAGSQHGHRQPPGPAAAIEVPDDAPTWGELRRRVCRLLSD